MRSVTRRASAVKMFVMHKYLFNVFALKCVTLRRDPYFLEWWICFVDAVSIVGFEILISHYYFFFLLWCLLCVIKSNDF